MSEYQYYEFQTIDRPLTEDEQAAVSQLSSRVLLSSTKAVFTYSYGDFRGDPKQVLAKYFDAMFYIANWGTQQLMFRFPKPLIDFESIQKYCVEDCITLSEIGNYLILDILFDNEEGFGWIEGEGYLESLIGLRDEILQQDYRALYLAWLKAITWQDVDEEEYEPPVPSGLRKLSRPLRGFVEIFEVDEYLLKVAAISSGTQTSISDEILLQAITKLSGSEGNTFLLRLAKGESNLSVELNKRLSEIIAIPQPESQRRRTIKQLLSESEKERKQEKIRQQQEAEAQHIKELEALAKREAFTWKDVDALIQRGQAKPYDEAVQLLLKLRDLAAYQNQKPAFQERLNQIHEQYSRRSAFIKRLRKVGLYQQ
ncbi:MAG: hypothetical protein AB4426_19475 [Xenococcaceae cyanobacterium]